MAGLLSAALLCGGVVGCRSGAFPEVPPGYREYAYVSNGGANTVTVLDLVALRQERTIEVGQNPTGMAVNPRRNEVYVVNSRSGSVSVIDASANRVVATIPVRRLPYAISVGADGRRAYVANAGSNSVSVLDLDGRRELMAAPAGEQQLAIMKMAVRERRNPTRLLSQVALTSPSAACTSRPLAPASTRGIPQGFEGSKMLSPRSRFDL